MRANLLVGWSCAAAWLACGLLLGSCGALDFVRPEGDGGWSEERRERETVKLARSAGVDLGTRTGDGAIAAAPTVEPATPERNPIDLPSALALASKGNRRIAESERQLAISEQQVRGTRGRLLPSTVGSGRYTWFTDEQRNQVQFPAGFPAGANFSGFKVRDSEFGVLNGTLTQPLDLTGELRHALEAAQAGYRGERARLWATTLEQQLGVVRAYFQMLEAKRLREVTDQTIELYRQQLANAESRYQSGRLTRNELLVVQVALRTAEEQRLQRDLAIDQARWALNQAIGADVNAPTEPADVKELPVVPAVSESLRTAYTENPALRSLFEEQQRLEENARSLSRGRLPRPYAGAAIDTSTSRLLRPQDVGSGFVGFTWDLGTDQRREAEISAAKIAAERNRTEIERQMREIESGVRFAQQGAAERLAALAVAETAVGQADENLRIRRQQFDVGRATSDDVLDAEALLAAQRATRATALYQAHVRAAELRTLMGLAMNEKSER